MTINDKYPLTTRKWCRECSNRIREDVSRVTTWYYAGDYGPLCSTKCAKPFETYSPILTPTGRVKRHGGSRSNVVRIEQRLAPRRKAPSDAK